MKVYNNKARNALLLLRRNSSKKVQYKRRKISNKYHIRIQNFKSKYTIQTMSSLEQQKYRKKIGRFVVIPGVLCYLEFVFHIMVFRQLDGYIIFPLLVAIVFGCFANLWSSFFDKKLNQGIAWVVILFSCFIYSTQLVYNHIFKTFLSIYSVGENGTDVMEFWKEAVNGIIAVFPGILVLFLPVPFFALLPKKRIVFEQVNRKITLYIAASAAILHLFTLLCLLFSGLYAHSPYDLYYKDFLMDLSMEKLGVISSIRLDFQQVFGEKDELSVDQEAFLEIDLPTITPIMNSSIQAGNKEQSESKELPTPLPIDTSPNILNIDFAGLAEAETDETIRTLHTYFAEAEPTNKNQYTGMFKDYNLILITAEGFSPWAVDQNLTPTLYKMIHEGFEFNNFYTPIWYTSTSDGEYVACTGLLPSGTNSFSKSSDNTLPFCLGWRFRDLNYSARAYHNHSYTYYKRNLTHPNMGYDFKGAKGGGLEVALTWPESDVEMMEVTVPEYVQDEKFHVYYMTVSGHLQYTFAGNYIAQKNRSYVEDLPYSSNVKAYKACQLELEFAMKNLLEQLRQAGVLDKTVIALSADHYPYGLTKEEINEVAGHPVEENFELYKNHFILWNSAMKEPIPVNKYCSSLDIMPTLCNLFGISYDSRLFMGQDIFSDEPSLIMFGNQSFITDQIMYNSKTREISKLTEIEPPEEYVKKYISIVRNKFNVSASILENDYYSLLLPYLDWEVKKKVK